nr:uncharacterized protein LOC110089636 isoform X1 [Pogona vitticeps]
MERAESARSDSLAIGEATTSILGLRNRSQRFHLSWPTLTQPIQYTYICMAFLTQRQKIKEAVPYGTYLKREKEKMVILGDKWMRSGGMSNRASGLHPKPALPRRPPAAEGDETPALFPPSPEPSSSNQRRRGLPTKRTAGPGKPLLRRMRTCLGTTWAAKPRQETQPVSDMHRDPAVFSFCLGKVSTLGLLQNRRKQEADSAWL